MKPKPTITIPKSRLRRQLEEAAAIKRDMEELLQELESQVTGRPVPKPGGWRHHPQDWPPKL